MFGRCANPACSTSRHPDQGKLFRLDVEIGNTAGMTKIKTAYVWLCDGCARRMNPRIEVAGNTVRVLLAALPKPPSLRSSYSASVN
jgi:hypothetical protein